MFCWRLPRETEKLKATCPHVYSMLREVEDAGTLTHLSSSPHAADSWALPWDSLSLGKTTLLHPRDLQMYGPTKLSWLWGSWDTLMSILHLLQGSNGYVYLLQAPRILYVTSLQCYPLSEVSHWPTIPITAMPKVWTRTPTAGQPVLQQMMMYKWLP